MLHTQALHEAHRRFDQSARPTDPRLSIRRVADGRARRRGSLPCCRGGRAGLLPDRGGHAPADGRRVLPESATFMRCAPPSTAEWPTIVRADMTLTRQVFAWRWASMAQDWRSSIARIRGLTLRARAGWPVDRAERAYEEAMRLAGVLLDADSTETAALARRDRQMTSFHRLASD